MKLINKHDIVSNAVHTINHNFKEFGIEYYVLDSDSINQSLNNFNKLLGFQYFDYQKSVFYLINKGLREQLNNMFKILKNKDETKTKF